MIYIQRIHFDSVSLSAIQSIRLALTVISFEHEHWPNDTSILYRISWILLIQNFLTLISEASFPALQNQYSFITLLWNAHICIACVSTVGQYYTESLIFDGRNFVIIHSVANSNSITRSRIRRNFRTYKSILIELATTDIQPTLYMCRPSSRSVHVSHWFGCGTVRFKTSTIGFVEFSWSACIH